MKIGTFKPRQVLFVLTFMFFLINMVPLKSKGQNTHKIKEKIRVSGVITDSSGNPEASVSVIVKGTTNGTVSQNDGSYIINVWPNATLVFSLSGTKPVEEKVNGRTLINVILNKNSLQLNDVVVVGYGTQNKKDVTGAISSVKMSKIEDRPSPNVESLLQGTSPGVLIKQSSGAPGGNLSVNIRGASSINAGTEPLYVIDGVPIYNDNKDPSGSSYGTYTGSNALVSLNPNDIASIQVLKDASATAIYGSRGSNGVIIITTKRGPKNNGVSVQYNGYYGTQKVANKLDLMNGEQQASFFNDWADANNITEPFPNPEAIGKGTDWQNQIFRTGSIENHEVSVSNRKKGLSYYVSGNYFDQKGIVINTKLRRYSFRANADEELGKRFKISQSFSFSRTINNAVPIADVGSGNLHSAGERAYETSPTIPVFDSAGQYVDTWYGANKPENPIASLNSTYSKLLGDNLLGDLSIEYKIINGLTFKTMAGINLSNRSLEEYYPKSTTYIGGILGGLGQLSTRPITDILNENTLTYNKVINNVHHIELLGGFTWETNDDYSWSVQTAGYPDDRLGVNAPGSSTSVPIVDAGSSKWSLASWLGRLNYQYKNKYLLTATFRADGSSKFGEGNKWGYFPSLAVGYRLSEDKFIQNLGIFNDLKLRGSYGLTGNQQIGTYNSLPTIINTVTYIFDNRLVSGSRQTSLANSQLKWEKSGQWDIGLDASMLDQRLKFTFDYYKKNTSDLLFTINLPSNSGYSSALANTGGLSNEGYEASVEAQIFKGSSFTWNIDANYSHNKTAVTSLGRSGSTTLFVNYAPGVYLGYNYEGVFHNQDEIDKQSVQPSAKPGDAKYEDVNGDGVINANDKVILGNPVPDYIFGLNNTLTYKGLDLSIFVQGVIGQKGQRVYAIYDPSDVSSNKSVDLVNRWTPSNTSSNIPRAGYSDRLSPSTYDLTSLSYVKIRNIRLGYNLPSSILAGIDNINIYVSGENLVTFTKYPGYDPDGGNDYPTPRTITFGLNVQF